VLAAATSIVEIDFDLAPALNIVTGSGLFSPELKALRDIVADGGALERDIGFLSTFTPDADGKILVDAVQVTLNTGDTITAIGVSLPQLQAELFSA
jgi:hypothetical protein